VLRNHGLMPDGTISDSYVYSVIASEWPSVKRNLQYHIETSRQQAIFRQKRLKHRANACVFIKS